MLILFFVNSFFITLFLLHQLASRWRSHPCESPSLAINALGIAQLVSSLVVGIVFDVVGIVETIRVFFSYFS